MRSDVANKRISFTEQFVYSKDASELGQNSGLIMAYLGRVNFLSEYHYMNSKFCGEFRTSV